MRPCRMWSKASILLMLIVFFTSSVLFLHHVSLVPTATPREDRKGDNQQDQRGSKGALTPKIYVYNWSEDVVNRWPKAYHHHRLSIQPQFAQNHGAGIVINPEEGFYHTHQYTLFSLFYLRLLQSKYITYDAKEATHFFIPYDLGMDSSTRESDAALTATNCPKLSKVKQLLQASPYFQASSGHNHFMVHSINHMMLHFVNKDCRHMYEFCYNCTKLSIDVYSDDLYGFLQSATYMKHRWYSIPFPSNFHIDSNTKPPWKKFTAKTPETFQEKLKLYKTHILGFVGGIEVTSKKNKEVRKHILAFCEQHPTHCLLTSLTSHSSNVDLIQETSVFDTVYGKSVFCFSPGGDFPTRKGFFDSMLSGCIPVLFEEASAVQQWEYHWGSVSKAHQCTYLIPRESFIQDPKGYFDALIALGQNMTFLREKFECIGSIGTRMQYSLPTLSSQSNLDEDDAFEVTIKLLQDIIA